MSTNRCICCGDEIPEGRIVCWRCEHSQPELDDAKGENTMSKDEIIRKLTSRKFWAAVVGFVTGLLIYLGKSEAETAQIGALIMSAASVVAYIVGEGLIDAAREKGDTYIIPDDEAHPPEK
jgi:hypothetical protein